MERSVSFESERERNQKFNKHPRIQATKKAKIGDVVQIKDTTPRRTWKIGLIIEMIKSTDGEEMATRVLIPNKNILQRLIVHLYPLECDEDKGWNKQQDENNTNKTIRTRTPRNKRMTKQSLLGIDHDEEPHKKQETE